MSFSKLHVIYRIILEYRSTSRVTDFRALDPLYMNPRWRVELHSRGLDDDIDSIEAVTLSNVRELLELRK